MLGSETVSAPARKTGARAAVLAGLVGMALGAATVPPETPPPVSTILPVPELGRGVGLTLFSNSGPRVALLDSVSELVSIRPQAVQVHGGPHALVNDLAFICTKLRELLGPSVRIWVGVQWDGWVSNYATARNDRERAAVVKVYVDAAKVATANGCEAIIWNSESKAHVNPVTARALERACVAQVRLACPLLRQALTTFDHPTVWDEVAGDRPVNAPGAAGFPWSAWLGDEAIDGDGSAVDFWMPQTYASPGTGAMASKGALTRRLSTHRASTAKAVTLRWIRPNAAEVLYFQGHHVPAVQTAYHGARERFVFVWAAPKDRPGVSGRLDGDGFAACRVLAEVARDRPNLEGLDPKALAAWCQGVLSVVAGLEGEGDGAFGAKSLAAARSIGWTGTEVDGALVALLKSRA